MDKAVAACGNLAFVPVSLWVVRWEDRVKARYFIYAVGVVSEQQCHL